MKPVDWIKENKRLFVALILLFVFTIVTIILLAVSALRIHILSGLLIIQLGLLSFSYFFFRTEVAKWTLKNNSFVKHLVSIYPGIAAFLLIFFRDAINKNFNNFIHLVKSGEIFHDIGLIVSGADSAINDTYRVSIWTVYYIFSVVFWIVAYYRFVFNESEKNEERNKRLESTILRAPNPAVFTENILINKDVSKALAPIDRTTSKFRELYHPAFHLFLESICKLTRVFMNKPEGHGGAYRANIMIFIDTSNHKDLVQFLREPAQNCPNFIQADIDGIFGILRLVPDLVSQHGNENSVEETQSRPFSLPVIRTTPQKFFEKNIPGAPSATVKGDYVINDVRDTDNYKDLDKDECDNVADYWKTQAPDVKSVISIRIPFNDQDSSILGVLNIDCTQTYPLGQNAEFHPTYWSLVLPLMQQILPYFKQYHSMYISDLQKVKSGGTSSAAI